MSLVITESPRDAMQGLSGYIPAQAKIDYINILLKVGFNIIDVGSFVSEKAIPQLKDTSYVIRKIDISDTRSSLMVLIANMKGIEKAVAYDEITWLAFPFSISKTFLKRNININPKQALQLIDLANNSCDNKKKKLKVYLTMAFGNPYQDEFSFEIVIESITKLKSMGIRYITLSDITGVSDKELISRTFLQVTKAFPDIEFGFHLHSKPDSCIEKIDAAFSNGCHSFDAVINAMGGCPMTGSELVSNLNTIDLLDYFHKNFIKTSINMDEFNEAVKMNTKLFEIKNSDNFLN